MSFDQREFRNALGCFPTGIAVITANVGDNVVGITVNSFSSVSLNPPLLLWCIDKRSDRFSMFIGAESFTISLLCTSHRDISSRLAKPGEHRLDGIELIQTELGAPALREALAYFECTRYAVHDAGDHAILVGRVRHFSRQETGAPLIFFKGKYGDLAHPA